MSQGENGGETAADPPAGARLPPDFGRLRGTDLMSPWRLG